MPREPSAPWPLTPPYGTRLSMLVGLGDVCLCCFALVPGFDVHNITGAVPYLVAIMRDNTGAAAEAAGAVEKLAGQPRFATAIIRQGGVSALVGLLNAGARECYLPSVRSLQLLSGLDDNVAHVIAKADGINPLVRRSAKGSVELRVAALSVLRDIARRGHSLTQSGLSLCIAGLMTTADG